MYKPWQCACLPFVLTSTVKHHSTINLSVLPSLKQASGWANKLKLWDRHEAKAWRHTPSQRQTHAMILRIYIWLLRQQLSQSLPALIQRAEGERGQIKSATHRKRKHDELNYRFLLVMYISRQQENYCLKTRFGLWIKENNQIINPSSFLIIYTPTQISYCDMYSMLCPRIFN